LKDETTGYIELDEIISGHGGREEGSDDDFDTHHDKEEDADGHLRVQNSGTLFDDILSVVCLDYAPVCVHGEVYHGRD